MHFATGLLALVLASCPTLTQAVVHTQAFNMTLTVHHGTTTCKSAPISTRKLVVTETQGCTDSQITFRSYNASVAADQKYQVGPKAAGCILYFYPEAGCAAPSRNDVIFEEVKKRDECVGFGNGFAAKSYQLQCNHFS